MLVSRGETKVTEFVVSAEFLLNANEDAANNFARGHYTFLFSVANTFTRTLQCHLKYNEVHTVGKENIDAIAECIRKLTDNSENVQGFISLLTNVSVTKLDVLN